MAEPRKPTKRERRTVRGNKNATKNIKSRKIKQEETKVNRVIKWIKRILYGITIAAALVAVGTYFSELFSLPSILIEAPPNPSMSIDETAVLIHYVNFGKLLKNFNMEYKLEDMNLWQSVELSTHFLGNEKDGFFNFTADVNRSCLISLPEYISLWIDNKTNQCYTNLPPNISICSFATMNINISGTYDSRFLTCIWTQNFSQEFECIYPFAISTVPYALKPINYYGVFGGSVTIPFVISVQLPSIKDCLPYQNGENKSLIFEGNFTVEPTNPKEYNEYREMACFRWGTRLSKEQQDYCREYLANYTYECKQIT